jgi:hypothetical protein
MKTTLLAAVAAVAIAFLPTLAFAQVSGGPIGAGIGAPPIGSMTAAGMGNRPIRPGTAAAPNNHRARAAPRSSSRRSRAAFSGLSGHRAP